MPVQLSVAGTSGNVVTVDVHNPDSTAQTLSALVTVRLMNGTDETIQSNSVTVQPSQTVQVQASASGEVKYVIDNPTPIME